MGLERTEALELPAGVPLGRVVFSCRALPAIRPVDHAVQDEGRVAFRTYADAAVSGPAGVESAVTDEADVIGPESPAGWSVIVTGVATLERNNEQVAHWQGVLTARIGGQKNHVVRIRPDLVTGYRLARATARREASCTSHPWMNWWTFSTPAWTKDAHDAQLFHELACPRSVAPDPSAGCACPCPTSLLAAVDVNAGILRRYEQRLERERQSGLAWPLESSLVFAGLKAMALPYELHPAWRDGWYP